MKLVGTRRPGSNPSMQLGWPGVIRVLTHSERRESEQVWDARCEAAQKGARQ